MNRLEISFAEPASEAWSLVQNTNKGPETKSVRNRSEVTNQEFKLIEALRKRDETTFETLIDRYHAKLLRLARMFVPNEAVAEEVVQETWVKLLEGTQPFEGRSSLEILIFQILTKRAQNRGGFKKGGDNLHRFTNH